MQIRYGGDAVSRDYEQRGEFFYPIGWASNWPPPLPRPWFAFDPSWQPPEWKPDIPSAEEDAELRRMLGTADT